MTPNRLRHFCLLFLLPFTIHFSAVQAQTLNVQVGQVTYLFPAEQTGVMSYTEGTMLTVMGKVFALNEVDKMYVDETAVTDSRVEVVYNGASAAVRVAGNIAQHLLITQTGAHIHIAQSDAVADEITYILSGTSSDGEFYLSGSYKTTVELNGLTLTNSTPVTSGAAVHIQNSKRIKVKVVSGTTNTLTDAAGGSQKGALYIKGHAEFAQQGTLNVTGKVKHGIKAGEYISIKNATINVLSAAGDGINCEQFFLLESGTVSISGAQDDGIQCDVEDTTLGSTGETANHEGEDSGNMYINGGTITVNCQYKCIKAEGNLTITNGTIHATSNAAASSNGSHWGSSTTSSPEAIEAKGTILISGGHIYAKSADDAINAGSDLTVSGGYVYAHSTSNDGLDANGNCYIKGGVVYAIGSTSPEVAIDANTEAGKKLYISGGTIIAVGNLESGASISGGTCKQTTSWTGNSWYALYNGGSLAIAFKTPAKSSSGGGGGPGGGGGGGSQKLVVYTSSTPTLKSSVTVSGGTEYFDGAANINGTVSGGSSVTLSNYSSSGGGPGGW